MPGKGKWFALCYEDRDTILTTMVRNLAADLAAGYDYFGQSAVTQRNEITAYKAKTDARLRKFREMTEQQINHWCYYDLIRRGAIMP